MKHIIAGMVTMSLAVLFFLAIMTLQTRAKREEEVTKALNNAVREAMKNLQENQKYPMYGETEEELEEEFIADFCQNFIAQISVEDPDVELKVDVAGVDYEKGLLSVCVTEEFAYPVFGRGRVQVSSTGILDTNYDTATHTISFYEEDGMTLYKRYLVKRGEAFLYPETTPWENALGHWEDAKGNRYLDRWPEKVDENYSFKACTLSHE